MLPGRTQGRALCPGEEFTFPKGSPKPLSAGTDAADSGPSRAHKAQLLLLIDAQLVTAAPGPGSRWDLVVSLGTRGQQEAHTASDEHMPNAVNVEVVVSSLHKSIEQDGTARDKAAWAQVEKPAAPRGRVAVPAADAAYCPGCGQDPQGKETGSKQVPESMPVKLQSHGQQHSPQQVQHLEKEVSRGWAGMERHLAMPPGEIGKWISSRLWLWLSPRAHSALTCLTTGCKRAMAMTVTHTDIKEPRKSQNCSTS